MTSENHPLSPPSPHFANYSSPSAPLIPTDEDSNTETGYLRRGNGLCVKGGRGSRYRRATMGMLSDETLLEIFGFYLEEAYKADSVHRLEEWHTLVHVCQKWRRVVFTSPRRLNLQLVCTSRSPVGEMLGIWPTLPIVIQDQKLLDNPWLAIENIDNIGAAFLQRDRVCKIVLDPLPLSVLERMSLLMLESFPTLTHLFLRSQAELAIILPDSFLGGSAPRLRELTLDGIAFPALPKLLLSTNDLVNLCLWNIPHSGYISPEELITCLSSLTNLHELALNFDSSQSIPDDSSRHLFSFTRVDLPVLVDFRFHGANDYIEDFVGRINAPLLCDIQISLVYQPHFDVIQLWQFIGRVEDFHPFHQAHMKFDHGAISIRFENTFHITSFELRIICTGLEEQLSSLAEICSPFSPSTLPSMHRLKIDVDHPPSGHWDDHMQNTLWLWVQLLRPFTALKDLYLSEELALRVVLALQEPTGEISTDLLPALRNIFVEGNRSLWAVRAAIGPFAAARQDSGRPVAVCSWKRWQEDDGWHQADFNISTMTPENPASPPLLTLGRGFNDDYSPPSASSISLLKGWTMTWRNVFPRQQQRYDPWVEDGQGPLSRTETIGILPDDVLLEVFGLYLEEAYKVDSVDRLEAWRTLVHVCQRWRRVVFASPRRLNLQLVCTSRKPVREMVGIWPAFPIAIQAWELGLDSQLDRINFGNIIAALEHRNRVCQIALESVPHLLFESDSAIMEPFPALTHLYLFKEVTNLPILPDSFLGGSAPRLRELILEGISFPSLPKLLLSTNDLVELDLWNTPHSGYIPPDIMVTCLASLTRLEIFSLGFNSCLTCFDESNRPPPSLSRINLPALLKFRIHGVIEYIEDFVARINTPLLSNFDVSCFHLGHLNIPQVGQFIDRIENFKAFHQAQVRSCEEGAYIKFANTAYTSILELRIAFIDAEEHPSCLAELCCSLPYYIGPSIERLDIVLGLAPPYGWDNDDIDNNLWLELLQLFASVQDLYLSKGVALRIIQVMQELNGGNTTHVLPALQNIVVEGLYSSDTVQEAIKSFIAVRQSSGHHVTVYRWNRRGGEDDYQYL